MTEESQTLPSFSVVAQNDAADSGNKIHDEETAKRLGFSGALVPGITVFAYAFQPLIAHFGPRFLESGFLSLRLRRPVYEGERVHTEGRALAGGDGGARFEVAVRNAGGDTCAVGEARHPLPQQERAALASGPPERAPLPEPLRPATPESLGEQPLLGTLDVKTRSEQLQSLREQLDDSSLLMQECVHPAWLLRQANIAIDRNLDLGPWIHVSSDVALLGAVKIGEPFSVRTRVGALYNRKGNDYADFDIAVVTDRPVMRIVHRAIYRLGDA
jgi:hypothetical protein